MTNQKLAIWWIHVLAFLGWDQYPRTSKSEEYATVSIFVHSGSETDHARRASASTSEWHEELSELHSCSTKCCLSLLGACHLTNYPAAIEYLQTQRDSEAEREPDTRDPNCLRTHLRRRDYAIQQGLEEWKNYKLDDASMNDIPFSTSWWEELHIVERIGHFEHLYQTTQRSFGSMSAWHLHKCTKEASDTVPEIESKKVNSVHRSQMPYVGWAMTKLRLGTVLNLLHCLILVCSIAYP